MIIIIATRCVCVCVRRIFVEISLPIIDTQMLYAWTNVLFVDIVMLVEQKCQETIYVLIGIGHHSRFLLGRPIDMYNVE
jgi:hypothetical protein